MSSVVYFDMDKQEIRSFKDYLLQKVQKRKTYSEYICKQQQPNEKSQSKPNEKPGQTNKDPNDLQDKS